MVSGINAFGQLDDGTSVEEIRLSADGLEASIITWGAVVRDLKVSVGSVTNRRVVLGLERLDDYLRHSPNFGAIAGRFANRIAHGQFDLDGRSFQLTRNQNGIHHLHGGALGFGKRVWTIADRSDAHVTLQIAATDGNEGYPGDLMAQCTYQIETAADYCQLVVDLTATTSAPTLVNLAQHSYFNLDETPDISGHHLQIQADAFLPTTDEFIPTGEITDVQDTDFDFRQPRPINSAADINARTYDNNFVISDTKIGDPLKMATLAGARGLSMDVISTEPGLQFYDGSRVNVPIDGIAGHPYGPFAGVCLEPQIWPDAPNHPNFPSAVLRPNETYRQTTIYGFRET